MAQLLLKWMTVDVDEMSYKPLDDEGYQRIETGDLVRVSGNMDYSLFEGRVLKASSLAELLN
jgi:hypothetical protein